MIVSRETMTLAHIAHNVRGASRDLLRQAWDGNGGLCVGGMSLVIPSTGALHVRLGPTDPGSVAIPLPSGTTVSDLFLAVWFYPLPALILQILRPSHARGEALNSEDQAMIVACEAAFLDCLTRRDWGERFADYVLTSRAWEAHRPAESTPS